MTIKNIDKLVNKNSMSIDYDDLQSFLNEKLNEIYAKEKITPLFDYADIRYSAMIDLLYEIMPSLKDKRITDKSEYIVEKPL